ncbi:MAG: hypothetical protein MJ138_03690 [Kiritimatiellae bacterium]|nr:hypothetical protein [Kiritimatiellia bacterium]
MKKAFAYALAAFAVAGCFGVNWWLTARRHARLVGQRRAAFAACGIFTDGSSAYATLPPTVPVREAVKEIGADLFANSHFGKSKRSCAACHPRDMGGTDGLRHGAHVTMPVENLAFQRVFGPAGAETNLCAVVGRMVFGEDYLAFPRDWDFRGRVGGGLRLRGRMDEAFGPDWNTNEVLTAIGEYAWSLITPPTRFDHFKFGAGHPEALDPAAKRGFDAFKDANCIRCHSGPALGGERAEKGVKVPALRGLSWRPLAKRGADALRDKASAMPGAPRSETKRADLTAFLRCL